MQNTDHYSYHKIPKLEYVELYQILTLEENQLV